MAALRLRLARSIRAMGLLAQLLGLKISLRAASGSEIGVNRGKSAQAGYTGYMGYMGYTGYTGYIQNKRVYGVYPEQGGTGYILTPGVNGVNGVKEEGRGMEGIWGKSPARGKRAATPGVDQKKKRAPDSLDRL